MLNNFDIKFNNGHWWNGNRKSMTVKASDKEIAIALLSVAAIGTATAIGLGRRVVKAAKRQLNKRKEG